VQTIKLGSALTIGSNVSIVGPGANVLTISGQGQVQVFAANSGLAASISDVNDSGVSNAETTLTIGAPISPLDFTFTDTGASAFTAAPGAVASYSFGLSPLNGSYMGPVSFTVSGLPAGATASFTPSTIAANGGATTVQMPCRQPLPWRRTVEVRWDAAWCWRCC
jgi:hypothetical protein